MQISVPASVTTHHAQLLRSSCSRTMRLPGTIRRSYDLCCRAEGGQKDSSTVDKSEEEAEARLAAFEASMRRNASAAAQNKPLPSTPAVSETGRAKWKEGQLLPEGFDKMDPLEKATELYLGDRGILFWANKAAFASIFILFAIWVIFRLIGPSLGLYNLANGVSSPPNI